jgi:hypothetical protein
MSFCFGPDGDEVKNIEPLGHAWLHPTRPASAYDSQSMLTRGCVEQRLRLRFSNDQFVCLNCDVHKGLS